ncbi:hypothetical protein PR048_008651 [Dryococelus australis]|uniref:Uncharacterized protein n=1 Tax=Dryococelus australis TaxID=614101 RepID=A0ABQ9HXQ5_9NEOP|nr:hypothetical protein PR048_008651 [Dryococelus australis]
MVMREFSLGMKLVEVESVAVEELSLVYENHPGSGRMGLDSSGSCIKFRIGRMFGGHGSGNEGYEKVERPSKAKVEQTQAGIMLSQGLYIDKLLRDISMCDCKCSKKIPPTGYSAAEDD